VQCRTSRGPAFAGARRQSGHGGPGQQENRGRGRRACVGVLAAGESGEGELASGGFEGELATGRICGLGR
jgi:hypothetical protein